MASSENINYLTLNQNIFNTEKEIDKGHQERRSKTPINTFKGIQVYLNGTHVMPKRAELIKGFAIGSMKQPISMVGMPSCRGDLSYYFWVTKKEYITIVRLKLDELAFGESEPAIDILALVKRNTLPNSIPDTEESYSLIAQEMILCHFNSLFEFYESIEELEDWTFKDDALHSFAQYHFELKKVAASMHQ